MNQNEVIDELVAECEADHVGLWELISAARLDLGLSDSRQVQMATLELARDLLRLPGMQVGFPAPDGRHFLPWDLSPDKALARIRQEWDALGSEPRLGDIAWFNLEVANRPAKEPT